MEIIKSSMSAAEDKAAKDKNIMKIYSVKRIGQLRAAYLYCVNFTPDHKTPERKLHQVDSVARNIINRVMARRVAGLSVEWGAEVDC